jgi:release factor glutamine methyltransferase
MTAKEIFDNVIHEIEPIYGNDEARSMAFVLLEHIGVLKTAVLSRQPMETDTSVLQKWIERLKKHEPIQYIIGETVFYKRNFKVSTAVLIPRPETEELVEWIIDYAGTGWVERDDEKINILDIGTGSGCIAVSLAKEIEGSEVTAIDISEEALKTARENARLHNASVRFLQEDMLQKFDFDRQLDIVVSNPPYVTEKEKEDMQPNVLRYEPMLALFVPDEEPLLFYRKIAFFCRQYLKPGGSCFLELNTEYAHRTAALFDEEGFSEIIIRKDISGRNRMMKAKK